MNASQLSLWEEPEPQIAHHHIEVHRQGGQRFVVCTAAPTRHYYQDEIYAGFVGYAASAQECEICKKEAL